MGNERQSGVSDKDWRSNSASRPVYQRYSEKSSDDTMPSSWDPQTSFEIPELQYNGTLASRWSPCTGGDSIGKFLESTETPISYRSLAIRWDQLGRPSLEHLRTPLDLLTGTREISFTGPLHSSTDLSDIAEAQEAMVIENLRSGIKETGLYKSIKLFVGFASHLDIYCAVNSELKGLEQGLDLEEQDALYWETCDRILRCLEQDRAYCAQCRPHRCLGLLLWGEVFTWSLDEKRRRFEAYKNRSRYSQISTLTLGNLDITSPSPTATSALSPTRDGLGSSPLTPAISPRRSSVESYPESTFASSIDTDLDYFKDSAQSSPVQHRHTFTDVSEFQEWTDYFRSFVSPQATVESGGNEKSNVGLLHSRLESFPDSIDSLPSPTPFDFSERGSPVNGGNQLQVPASPLTENSFNLASPVERVRSFSDWKQQYMERSDSSRLRMSSSNGLRSSSSQSSFLAKRKRATHCGCIRLHAARPNDRAGYQLRTDEGFLDDDDNDDYNSRSPSSAKMRSDLEHQRMLTERYETMLKNAIRKLDSAASLHRAQVSRAAHPYTRSTSESQFKRQSRS